jgi:hypothetical protein
MVGKGYTMTLTVSMTDLGTEGWRRLWEVANQRKRKPSDQAKILLLYGLERLMAGEDVEPSQKRLDMIQNDPPAGVA